MVKRLAEKIQRIQQRLLEKRVERIIASAQTPDCTTAERDFEYLQSELRFERRAYGYDSFSCWTRATERAHKAIQAAGLHDKTHCSVLDLCCGDGMLGPVMGSFGFSTELADLEDWRIELAKRFPFQSVDLATESLPYADGSFDLVCSYNAFEHIPDPLETFHEMLRVCKPRGYVRLEFGPLFASPWGLHAYRTLSMPYPQFLFSNQFLENKLSELGIVDLGSEREELQPMNRWTVRQFLDLLNVEGISDARQYLGKDYSCLYLVVKYPRSFQGRGVSLQDLVTSNLTIQVCKAS